VDNQNNAVEAASYSLSVLSGVIKVGDWADRRWSGTRTV